MPPTPEDLALCRALHQRGRVPEAALRAALDAVGPGRSLAMVLVERGLLSPREVPSSTWSALGRTSADASATFAPPAPRRDEGAFATRPGDDANATRDPDLVPMARPGVASSQETVEPDARAAAAAPAPGATHDPELEARARAGVRPAAPRGETTWLADSGRLPVSATPPPGPPAAAGAPQADWKVGGFVGRFGLDRELGRGGMGVVYAATDQETGRRVAIKTLLPGASPTSVARFLREGQAQAAVDEHPNVLRVHHAGEAGGRQFLVMDLAPGGDLASRLKHGPLPPREAAALALALARGLAHVHAQGVLHRDLKPANVLFDEHGVPRLVDFGLAALEGAERLTATAAFMGTPAYMAPEQTGGERVGPAADVYGLGAVLYHMLCGRPPFEGDGGAAIVSRLLTQPPPPPRQLVPEVPEGLERVVLKCLAKLPAQRYAGAASLAADLERALAGESVEARAPATARGAKAAALAGVAAAVLVAGAVVAVARLPDAIPPGPPVATTAPAPVAPAGPTRFEVLASRTYGLPAREAREYRLQWYTLSVSPAFMSLRATLRLGPAQVGDDGVVTCPATLSEMTVWCGAPDVSGIGMGADEFDFDEEGTPLQQALLVTIRPGSPAALQVSGVNGAELLERIPEHRRWNLVDAAEQHKTRTWLGVFARSFMTDQLLCEILRAALPRLANEAAGLGLRATRERCTLVKDLQTRLLLVNDAYGLTEGSRVDAEWTLEEDGTVKTARFEEQADERTEPGQGPGRVAKAWLRLGKEGSFEEVGR